MPQGIAVMEWDNKGGTDIIGLYPENTKINKKVLLQVYNTHASNFNNEAGITNFSDDKNSILSYYSGNKWYIILILNMLEDYEDYEEIFITISKKILDNLEKKSFKGMLPALFNDITQKKSED